MLLKRKEAAALLGVEPKTLDTWVERAGLSYDRDRIDHRLRLLTQEQVETIASEHGRTVKTSPMEQRINELESELAHLRQRASWLFEDAPSAQSAPPTHGEGRETPAHTFPARLHSASRTRPLSLARLHGGAPDGWKTLEEMCERHEVGVTTAKVAGKDGRLSVRYETYVHPTAANARVSHWLDADGQRQFHTAFQRTFASPCEFCGLDWRASVEDEPIQHDAP